MSNRTGMVVAVAGFVTLLIALALPSRGYAVITFAQATGQPCITCHTDPNGAGGVLNAFGQRFAAIPAHETDPAGVFAQLTGGAAPAATAAPVATAVRAATAAPAATAVRAATAAPAATVAPLATAVRVATATPSVLGAPAALPSAGEASGPDLTLALVLLGVITVGAGLVYRRRAAKA